MLFLGSFRHLPNQEGLEWFTRFVLPRVLQKRPGARLVVVGSDPPARHTLPGDSQAVEIVGFVEDIQAPLHRYGIFVCPILSGSGVRVKLLEAFASGIPVVSTRIGAEGLASGRRHLRARRRSGGVRGEGGGLLSTQARRASWRSEHAMPSSNSATCEG